MSIGGSMGEWAYGDIIKRLGDDIGWVCSKQRYTIGLFYSYHSQGDQWMSNDWINRIDSRAIKTVRCAFAWGFYSAILLKQLHCMYEGWLHLSFGKFVIKVRADTPRRTMRHKGADGLPPFEFLWAETWCFWWELEGEMRTVRPERADGPPAYENVWPETLLVLVAMKVWTADGPPPGCGRSVG